MEPFLSGLLIVGGCILGIFVLYGFIAYIYNRCREEQTTYYNTLE